MVGWRHGVHVHISGQKKQFPDKANRFTLYMYITVMWQCHIITLQTYEITDGQVVRAGVSVTWNVLSWSGGHERTPLRLNLWWVVLFCPKSYLNQKLKYYQFWNDDNYHIYPSYPMLRTSALMLSNHHEVREAWCTLSHSAVTSNHF